VPFSCHPDRVERLPALGPGLAVVDLKTGKVPLRKYQGPYRRQVVIGSMGVAATMAQGPAQQGSLLYIGQSETVPVDTSLKARTETLRDAQGTWEAITEACSSANVWQDFPPNVGPLCGFCPAAADCDAGTAYIRRAWSSGWKSFYPNEPATQAVIALYPEMAPAEAF
jgi:RecB family exonuclease